MKIGIILSVQLIPLCVKMTIRISTGGYADVRISSDTQPNIS